MQEEGAARAKVLKLVADTIDTWGPQVRAALEMNVFNPETPLRDMEVDEIDALKERYLNTKFLLNQSRNPFPASLLRELHLGGPARVTREQGRGMPSTGAFGPEEQTPEAIRGVPAGTVEFQILKRLIELHIGGKWKRERGPLNAPAWAKPLPEAERMMVEMRTHARTFRSAFFAPIALTQKKAGRPDCHGGPAPPRAHCWPLPCQGRRRGGAAPSPRCLLRPCRASKLPLRYFR